MQTMEHQRPYVDKYVNNVSPVNIDGFLLYFLYYIAVSGKITPLSRFSLPLEGDCIANAIANRWFQTT